MGEPTLAEGLRRTVGVFEGTRPNEPLTTTEVMDQLGISRQYALDHLDRLVDRGVLAKKTIDSGQCVWWQLPEPFAERTTDSLPAESKQSVGIKEVFAENSLLVREGVGRDTGVVRDISEAVMAQSSREGIEQVVCDRLAATDSYEFAWIGDVDHRTQTVRTSAEAGAEDYLSDITISVDPTDERSNGPTSRAVRERSIQVSQEVPNDTRYERWRDHAEAYGYRSAVAIPIVHDEMLYGVLNVYTDRPNGFSEPERSVVEQLGEVVGHGIAAVERKRALMSDEVVELGFHVTDPFSMLDRTEMDGTVTFDEVVAISDNEFILYGSITKNAGSALDTLTGVIDHWESVTLRDGDDGTQRFELHLSDPPVLSALASVGGSIVDAGIEDGVYHMTVQLPPGGGVRTIIDTIHETYPSATMVTRQQKQRERVDSHVRTHELADSLTDRQRVAMQAAYYAGFFEWPRAVSGKTVAESLGVAAPTFHQHLRKAEKKIFDSIVPTLWAGTSIGSLGGPIFWLVPVHSCG